MFQHHEVCYIHSLDVCPIVFLIFGWFTSNNFSLLGPKILVGPHWDTLKPPLGMFLGETQVLPDAVTFNSAMKCCGASWTKTLLQRMQTQQVVSKQTKFREPQTCR